MGAYSREPKSLSLKLVIFQLKFSTNTLFFSMLHIQALGYS